MDETPEECMASLSLCCHAALMKTYGCLSLVMLLGACDHDERRACSPPRDYWRDPAKVVPLETLRNRVALGRNGQVYWNGNSVTQARLGELLKASRKMNPMPGIYLEAEMGVLCSDLDKLRDQMDMALECHTDGRHCLEGLPDGFPHPVGE
ncbi:hypothetical protein [Novosphingobium sp.]|uniref:hypothetical protein n=1 Tax=Novosphingobium sp. TaxID=1874826 RepID=UPI0031D15517